MLDALAVKHILIKEDLIEHSMMSISEDFDLIHNGILDSIGIMKLVLTYQRDYGMSVELSDITKDSFRTIAHIIDFFQNNSRPDYEK